MLVEKKRLLMHTEIESWRLDLLKNGLLELPLQGAIAIRAGRLAQFHGDPADRLIVATALEHNATIITADERVLSWPLLGPALDARR